MPCTTKRKQQCVVPENIHTPTMKGILRKIPAPTPPEFPFVERKITPHPPIWNNQSILCTPIPQLLWNKI